MPFDNLKITDMKNVTVPKVFVIEDRADSQRMFIDALAGLADVISAYNLRDALKIFEREEGITIIACDACLADTKPDTLDLVKLMRSKFSGPMVAISDSQDYNDELQRAGCSHKVKKDRAPEFIINILGQPLIYPLVPVESSGVGTEDMKSKTD